jgi:hypothetical protein
MNLMNTVTLATSVIAVAGGMASSAQANKVTFPVTINAKNQPIAQLMINGMKVNALLDTGANGGLVFGMKAAAALGLPNQGAAGNAGGVGGAAALDKTTVPAGSTIVGAMGVAAVAPVAGPALSFTNMNFAGFDVIAGADFLNTSDANGAFVLNAAKGTGTIFDKAQAAALAALPLNTPTTAVATGSLNVPGGGTPPTATVGVLNGSTLASAPFVLSTGLNDTLISQSLADSLGTLTAGPTEIVMSDLGTFTVSTAILDLNVFSQQGPVMMTVGILPDSLNPDNINVLGMDFYDKFSELIWNGATSTFSAAVVPEPGAWSIIILGVGMLGWRLRRGRMHGMEPSIVAGTEGPLARLLSSPRDV